MRNDWDKDNFNDEDDYAEVYQVDTMDEWENSAYDEEGNAAACDICGSDMRWSPERHVWYCPECGEEMDRAVYFNHIGAEPPGSDCLTNCNENYPFCTRSCMLHPPKLDNPFL